MTSEAFIGNEAQTSGAQTIQFLEGKATGMKAVRMYNEAGLNLLVAPDRGMDIPELKVHGTNVSFMSSTGLVNSTYFVEHGTTGFMRNFNVGFLTTGGLSYMGASGDSELGLHGTIGNTPAENFSHQLTATEVIVSGAVRETAMFGVNLVMNRKIVIPKNETKIRIHDVVINEGVHPASLMMQYHMNFGYPFFSPESQLVLNAAKVTDRDGDDVNDWNRFDQPAPDTTEKVYFHDFSEYANKDFQYRLLSPTTGLQAVITIFPSLLSVLNEWKLTQTKNYVLGLEPATNNVNGIEAAKRSGNLKIIEPNERVTFDLEIAFSKLEV